MFRGIIMRGKQFNGFVNKHYVCVGTNPFKIISEINAAALLVPLHMLGSPKHRILSSSLTFGRVYLGSFIG